MLPMFKEEKFVELKDPSPSPPPLPYTTTPPSAATTDRLVGEFISQNPLTSDQLDYQGEPALKAARVLGEAKLATKSPAGHALLGLDHPTDTSASKAMLLANKALVQDKKRRQNLNSEFISETELGGPSQEQIQAPMNKMNAKALALLGSPDLLAPTKARKLLGSDPVQDQESRQLADKQWLYESKLANESYTNRILRLRHPSELGRSINGPVSEKALRFFGEEELNRRSRAAIQFKVPPKAIEILGEPVLAGRKAERVLGGDFEQCMARQFQPVQHHSMATSATQCKRWFRAAVGGSE